MKQLKQSKQKKGKAKLNEFDIRISDFQMIADNILVEPIIIDESYNGVIKPQQYEDKPEYGKVLVRGRGRILENGNILDSFLSVGDIVLFNKYSSTKINVEGKDLLIIREEDVVAIV